MKPTIKSTCTPSSFLGIDVGNKDLFCHITGLDQPSSERFDNTATGMKSLLKWLKKKTITFNFPY